jgi:hypothetical protein
MHSSRPTRAAILLHTPATPSSKGDKTMLDITTLPPTAQIAISELETSKARNRRGIIPLSRSQIRRLEAQGLFPPSRRIAGTRGTFYLAGEVKNWIEQQANPKE